MDYILETMNKLITLGIISLVSVFGLVFSMVNTPGAGNAMVFAGGYGTSYRGILDVFIELIILIVWWKLKLSKF